jgi:hypothetical protein
MQENWNIVRLENFNPELAAYEEIRVAENVTEDYVNKYLAENTGILYAYQHSFGVACGEIHTLEYKAAQRNIKKHIKLLK